MNLCSGNNGSYVAFQFEREWTDTSRIMRNYQTAGTSMYIGDTERRLKKNENVQQAEHAQLESLGCKLHISRDYLRIKHAAK